MAIESAPTRVEHLTDLRRDLADWLRAHAGWTEAALEGACSLTAEAVYGDGPIGATAAVEGPAVHLHVEHCREVDLIADTHPGHVELAAHHGDILLRTAG